ncbi:hypothetical protein, partial [Lutibacter sp.]|uniref:hypothetical protein n=1 Tax=Lutibacter sp. TaxID=1925666 RepID=UPI0034A084A8
GEQGLQLFYPQFETVPQNMNFNLHIHVSNISNGFPLYNTDYECNIHLYNSTGDHTFEGTLENNGNEWDKEVYLTSGNFSDLGTHAFYIWCNNTYLGGEVRGTFEVSPTGEPQDLIQLSSRIFLIVFMLVIIIFIQWNSKRINYDSWYLKMAKRYENKNWVKFGLSALGYNLMKNSWIFSYLIGLVGLLILTELTYFFNITSALDIMKIVLGLYSWSAILVSLIFFSQVQEWIVGWLDDLQNLNWGIDKQ